MGFVKNSTLYVGISMFKKAIPLIMMYFLTAKIPTASMGSLELFNSLNNFFGIIISLSLVSYLMRIFYEKEKQTIAELISGGFVLQFIIAGFVFVLLYLSRVLFGDITKLSPIYDLIIPLGAFISLIPTTSLYILRNEEKVKQFGIFVILSTIIEFTLSIYLLLYTDLDWESRVYSVFITNSIFFIIHLLYLNKLGYLTTKINLPLLRKGIKHCLPFIPGGIALFFIDMSDRYIIEHFLDKSVLGVYSTGYKFGSIILIVANAINMAFIPLMYKLMAKKDFNKYFFVQFIYIYQIIVLFLTFLSYLGVEFLYYINFVQGEDYKKSIIFVPIISIAYLFSAYQQIYNQLVNKTSYVKLLPIVSVIGGVVNIGLNIYFIPRFGVIVACYSTLASFVVMWFLSWLISYKYYPLPWFDRKSFQFNIKEIKKIIS